MSFRSFIRLRWWVVKFLICLLIKLVIISSGDHMVIITDPPFGGRTEPIGFTFEKIIERYQRLNNRKDKIPIFWIYPYFMEPHISHTNLEFSMLDYKVEYENHAAFGKGPKARKFGSPIRIFTTANPRYKIEIY